MAGADDPAAGQRLVPFTTGELAEAHQRIAALQAALPTGELLGRYFVRYGEQAGVTGGLRQHWLWCKDHGQVMSSGLDGEIALLSIWRMVQLHEDEMHGGGAGGPG